MRLHYAFTFLIITVKLHTSIPCIFTPEFNVAHFPNLLSDRPAFYFFVFPVDRYAICDHT